jgi:MoCo/4Fe-4S cofactor protein with predicted Tat translocation signal
MPSENDNLDLASAQGRLEKAKGPNYWRSLEELAASKGFEDLLHREFPQQASEWDGGDEGRRNFLKLMGASLALGGLSACTRQPTEHIFPYVNAPENVIPGKPLYYATAFTMSGVSTGILMESHMGRPTKVEGNPLHPASLGGTDVMTQASVLGLYDPDRSQTLNFLGEIRTYASFLTMIRDVLSGPAMTGGNGVRILTETIGSPALGAQMKAILAAHPAAKWYQYEPLGTQNARLGSKLAFGSFVNTYYKFDAADIVLAIDSDFLCIGPASARYAHDFIAKRRVRGEEAASMNRLYAVESTPTPTGAKADHRFRMKPSEIAAFTRALASSVGVAGSAGSAPSGAWFTALVKDLQAHQGSSIVIAGDEQSPEVHALVHAINGALGNAGKTVVYTDPIDVNPADHVADLKALCTELDSGKIELLVIVGGNPVYNAPADLAFADKLPKARLRVRLGLYDDETSALCQWHVPAAHTLESWGDGRAYDGTVTIMQPLIAPLYGGKSPIEFTALFTENPEQTGYEAIRAHWAAQHTGADFETWWRKSVHDGVVAGSALPAKTVTAGAIPAAPAPSASGLELSFHADPYIYDGQFANNGWLQELPRPLTRLTWDNAVLISPATAKRLNVQTEDVVQLKYDGRAVTGAVWVTPGQPDDSLAVTLGFGRTRAGRAGNGSGFDVYPLRTSQAPVFIAGVEFLKLSKKYTLATTQHQSTTAKREVARSGTLAEYRKNPEFAREIGEEVPDKGQTIYPETFKYEGYAWGMSIDLGACTGCNACVVACQSENNIAIVGKDQVNRERIMHWLRIDRYYDSDAQDNQKAAENPRTVFEPVACVHCEDAPCELVCPVAATVHDQDGLNNMIYNRCVGTRYCSNNCPYKVRRFNFYLYSDWNTESVKLQKNPDVTVRSRGVMEKCTYCVQRINYAKITAEKEDRKVRDGEIVTACEAACPTQAITFGDLNDPASRVTKEKKEGLTYALLGELNTRPRTTHMAALRNPNPEIGEAS